MNNEEKTEEKINSELWDALSQAISNSDARAIKKLIEETPEGDISRALYHLSSEDRVVLMESLSTEDAAHILESINYSLAAEIVTELKPNEAADLLENLDSNEAADLLNELSDSDAEEVLELMEPAEAEQARKLSLYPEETAGALMIKEFLSFNSDLKAGEIINELEKNAKEYENYNIQYIYIVDQENKLKGVIRLRDLLFKKRTESVKKFMLKEPKTIRVDDKLIELMEVFDASNLLAMPVVSYNNELLGVLRRADVEEEFGEKISEEHLRTQGIVGGDELRSMPVWKRSGRRISWLSVNIILNIISASVIALYQDTLAAAITLAVFLPIISDMSGCSGNQAVAVSMRELSLGLVRPFEVYWVFIKEIAVGLINGIVLGLLIFLAALLWKGNIYLGLVVGTALCVNTILAVCLGGTIPLLLKKFNLDPALASGPLLTTVTDMSGFLLLLSLAEVFLPKLA